MIEMVIIAAIMSSITMRVAGNVAVDGFFAARGQESPRYTRAKARRKPGAASRYWSEVWDDAWSDASKRRSAKRADPSRPRGAARTFLSNQWRDGWVGLERKRQARTARPRPETTTVPGSVVPNSQDEDDLRPEDGPASRPVPDPHIVPTQDGTDLTFGDDPTDPTGVSSCPECKGAVVLDGEICLSCRDRQEQRNQQGNDAWFEEFNRPYVEAAQRATEKQEQEDEIISPAPDAWIAHRPGFKDCRNCDGYPDITFNSLRHEHDEFCLAPGILFPTDKDGLDDWQDITLTDEDDDEIFPEFITQRPFSSKDPFANPLPLQEGTTMTATTTEITGLDAAISWCDQSTEQYRAEITSAEATGAHCSTLAKSYRAQVAATEAVEASITGAGVTGPALARLTAVREKADAAAWAMERAEAEFATVREMAETAAADCEAAAAEFRAFKPGQEFYDARPDAPGREFLTAGR